MNFKVKNLIFYIVLVILFGSCQKGFFDQVPDDRLNIDDVFKRRTTTEQYLANIYSYIRTQDDWRFDNSFEGLSDDVDITWNDMAPFQLNLGNWDINTGSFNRWNSFYRAIRAASYFIQRVGENPELTQQEITQWSAEARFLRAYYYAELLQQYGPVILMPDLPLAPDATLEELSLPRNSYDECVDYIVSELDASMNGLLPEPVNSREWNRINQSMALALKSRVLLYAASPLFNGNTDYSTFTNKDGKQLITQQYDESKWKRAADAAKAVIDLGRFELYIERDNEGEIDPYKSLKNVHLNDWNSEIIMAHVAGDNMFGADKCASPRNVGGWAGFGVTQSLIDDFYMNNGRPISDPESGYQEAGFTGTETNFYAAGTSNMYVNREPRFYVSITFNLSKWINTDKGSNGQPAVIQLYNGGNSGMYTGRNYSKTGYVARKLTHPSTTLEPDRFQGRMETIIRLAEIYLNYAESLNEYSPGHPDIIKYLNLIRQRAGIPVYGTAVGEVPIPSGKEAMRAAIRQERRVELCFENLRFFDTKRWKIAAQTNGGAMYGMNVAGSNTTEFTKRTVFETRPWKKQYYLWNIVQDELNKNKQLVGNPDW